MIAICERCGKPAAYVGARFCGAACTARWEAGDQKASYKLELSPIEVLVLQKLLKMAADEFGAHGSNDFSVADELGLSKKDGEKYGRQLLEQMLDTVAEPELLENFNGYLIDWMIFSHLRIKIDRLIK